MTDSPDSTTTILPKPKRRGWLRISTTGIDKEESDEIQHLIGFAHSLEKYSATFFYALTVFDFGMIQGEQKREKYYSTKALSRMTVEDQNREREIDILRAWPMIAGRDGAMTLFHYSKTLDSLKASVSSCPSLSKKIDHSQFREVRRAFRQRFPDFEAVRHGVAHAGELLKNQKSRELNYAKGPLTIPGIAQISDGGTMFIDEMIFNRQFTKIFEGKPVSYDVSFENWQFLEQSVDDIYALFKVCEDPGAHTY